MGHGQCHESERKKVATGREEKNEPIKYELQCGHQNVVDISQEVGMEEVNFATYLKKHKKAIGFAHQIYACT